MQRDKEYTEQVSFFTFSPKTKGLVYEVIIYFKVGAWIWPLEKVVKEKKNERESASRGLNRNGTKVDIVLDR